MAIDSAMLQQVTALVSGSNPNYAAACQLVSNHLSSNDSGLRGAQADVASWVGVAYQVNSGEVTNAAITTRLNNEVADFLENGEVTDLFGPEEQASSNAVAQAFFAALISNSGQIQSFDNIIEEDAGSGLMSLSLSAGGIWSRAPMTGGRHAKSVHCTTGDGTSPPAFGWARPSAVHRQGR